MITGESIISTVAVGAALFALMAFVFSTAIGQHVRKLSALGAGVVLGAVLMVVLPAVYAEKGVTLVYVAIGALLVPVLHVIFMERQSDAKKVRTPLSGVLSLVRVALVGLVFGDAIALAGTDALLVAFLSIGAFFCLAPDMVRVYELLHYEGAKKTRAFIVTSVAALMPLLGALAVGSLILVAMPALAMSFVGLAAGMMLYLALAEHVREALVKEQWVEFVLALVGAIVCGVIVVLL